MHTMYTIFIQFLKNWFCKNSNYSISLRDVTVKNTMETPNKTPPTATGFSATVQGFIPIYDFINDFYKQTPQKYYTYLSTFVLLSIIDTVVFHNIIFPKDYYIYTCRVCSTVLILNIWTELIMFSLERMVKFIHTTIENNRYKTDSEGFYYD